MTLTHYGCEVAAEAMKWVGTPFSRVQTQKGLGCDCTGLLVGVFVALGVLSERPSPPIYPSRFWRYGRDLITENLEIALKLVPPTFEVMRVALEGGSRARQLPRGVSLKKGDVAAVGTRIGAKMPNHVFIVTDEEPWGWRGVHADEVAHSVTRDPLPEHWRVFNTYRVWKKSAQ